MTNNCIKKNAHAVTCFHIAKLLQKGNNLYSYQQVGCLFSYTLANPRCNQIFNLHQYYKQSISF